MVFDFAVGELCVSNRASGAEAQVWPVLECFKKVTNSLRRGGLMMDNFVVVVVPDNEPRPGYCEIQVVRMLRGGRCWSRPREPQGKR